MDNQSFLLDKDFLKKLDIYPRKEVYARITSLAFNEQPIEQIEGLVTAGSVNVDGTSSIRRTCSLTMISDQLNLKDYNWAIKTKFRLEVGLRNEIDDRYPDICWFPLGLYVITSFTSSIQSNNRSISIQGKDKMCLLTGDLGGNLPSIIDFGREEWYDYDYTKVIIENATVYNQQKSELYIYVEDSETKIKKPKLVTELPNSQQSYSPIQTYYKRAETYTVVNNLTADIYNYNADQIYYIKKKNNDTEEYEYILATGNFDESKIYYQKTISQVYHITPLTIQKIIKEAIHTWAREPYNNIIINDLDTYGLEQMIYNSHSDTPMYIIKNTKNKTFNVTLNDKQKVYLFIGDTDGKTLSELRIEDGFIFDTGIIDATKVSYKNNPSLDDLYYTILKVNDTDDCGYRITDLTYTPEDGLVCTVGEALSSILDKIKNMLGDFEYFYNLQGQFVFQRKPASANVNLSAIHNIDLQNLYVEASTLLNKVEYDFTNNYLISAINLNPTLNNVKNDYAIQGSRTTASGAQVPIRLRYAIDKKPIYYKAIDGKIYISKDYYDKTMWEQDKITRKLKQINTTTNKITNVTEADWLDWRNEFWTQEIQAYLNQLSQENKPIWNLHYETWSRAEHFYFNTSDILNEDDFKISKNSTKGSYNIQYKAGWWDLEAWKNFYEKVSQQPANKNLILYSAHTKDKLENSRSWASFQTNHYQKYQSWQTSSDYAPKTKLISSKNNRIFIFISDNIFDTERDAPWGTIEVTNPYSTTVQEYETSHYYMEVTFDSPGGFALRGDNCYTANKNDPNIYSDLDFTQVPNTSTNYNPNIKYYQRKYNIKPSEENQQLIYFTLGYPEIFGIDKSWTYDLAIQKFIPRQNSASNKAAWIFNPQFPEGSFEAAFDLGVKTWKENQMGNLRFFYAADVQIVDWREIIYQMSKDYFKYAMSDTIVSTTEFQTIFGNTKNDWWPYGYDGNNRIPLENIPENKRLVWRDIFTYAIKQLNKDYYPTGITGYEQYYTDINAFWRSCYNTQVTETLSFVDSDIYKEITLTNASFPNRDKNNCYYKDSNEQYQAVSQNASYQNIQYYRRLKLWKSDYFFSQDDFNNIYAAQNYGQTFDPEELSGLYKSDELRGWNYKLYYNPTALDFWFDFLEDGEIADKYSVKQIGLRTKAENNDKVKAVYYTKVPLICYYTADGTEGWKDRTDDQVVKEGGYSFVSLPTGMEKYFTISSRGISAKDELDNLLYQFSYVPENITLTSLPIYYLEPNTRIYVHDNESQIDGEYIMTKFTLPLTHNGTMSITANKAPERIL